MALSATVLFKKLNWLECLSYHYLLLKNQFTNTLLLGDSIIGGLLRYFKVCQIYFIRSKTLHFGTGGHQMENVLWQSKNLLIPPSLKNVVVLCGTNNLLTDSPLDIADCIDKIVFCFHEKSSGVKVFICGLIPRDESWSVNSVLIKDVNRILKDLCLKHDFSYIDESNDWTLPNGHPDPSLFLEILFI